MRIRRLILRLLIYYAIVCVTLAIALGELAFHPERIPLTETASAKTTAARFRADLQNVSVTASDGTRLQTFNKVQRGGECHAVASVIGHSFWSLRFCIPDEASFGGKGTLSSIES